MAPTNDELDRAVKDLQKQVTLLKQFITPTGTIIPFAGATAPSGWLLCDGSAIGRVEYAALFEVIKETYGAGDSSTTFNLPDLRGRTAIGLGQGTGLSDRTIGQAIGEENHTLIVDEIPRHAHTGATAGAGNHAHSGATAGAGNHAHSGSVLADGGHSHSGSVVTGGGHSHSASISGTATVSGFKRESGRGFDSVSSGGGRAPTPNGDVPQFNAHAHGVSVAGGGDHAHGITIDVAGNHQHGITTENDHQHGITTESDHQHGITTEGGELPHNNMPPSLVLNYIIKI